MAEVWAVVSEWGEWSDYVETYESIWDSEAGAVSHIVREIGAELDPRSKGEPTWVGGDGDDVYPTYYHVEHRHVRHG